KPLLLQIFHKNTPLHDGAAIIKGNRVLAAGCYLPLSQSKELSRELGSRHRAGVGLSEQSDALVLIVSEETGTISVAEEGKLTRYLEPETLSALLERGLAAEQQLPWRVWERDAFKKKDREEKEAPGSF
ncbi:MAG: DNA integrity scanning protein DisA nucleotide-binding domain protein, partial [Candidatus Desulforudis sp.]|nr:DNA integrity scanning protein DisA nucleotide-binding domain protein [Desulforudis sp.]